MSTFRHLGPMSVGRLAGPGGLGSSGFGPRRAELWLVRKLIEALGLRSFRVEFWGNRSFEIDGPEPRAILRIPDRRTLLWLLRDPRVHFPDAYCVGLIDIQGDFVRFLEHTYRAMLGSPGRGVLHRFLGRSRAVPRRNSLQAARENIHSHYDLGNDFYRLWLDEQMLYTCAYFPTPEASLEAAQVAKMDLVCRKLRLRPGQTVLETGCGWGALALHMARHYGARVRAYNISHEQVVFARRRAAETGLAGRVEFVEDDYRNAAGTYDAFVSVGMLEHVGIENFTALGGVIDRCLAPHGLGLIHTIGRNTPAGLDPWIEKRIFPGACPPTPRQMMDIFEPFAFSVLDLENIRLHYARTLEHWLARFERHAEKIEKMYDAAFVRAWRLYLCGSIAAFTTGQLQLFQAVFARGANNAVPWTRRGVYSDTDGETAGERSPYANV